MKFLSLFAGIGGFDLGLERAGMECVGQVEYNPFCQRVLKHHWPHVKLVGDIHDVTADSFGAVDLICGGFPCQPFSCAGKQRGQADDRYLWPEMLRIIKTYRSSWVLGENVTGIIGVELDKVLSSLESIGYTVQVIIIPACAVDAYHRRDRAWIVAYSKSARERGIDGEFCKEECGSFGKLFQRINGASEDVLHSNINGLERNIREPQARGNACGSDEEFFYMWDGIPAPRVCRTSDGIPNRMDRLRSLGNAVVPQVVEAIGRAIIQAEEGASCA